jgi:hypothetical protein
MNPDYFASTVVADAARKLLGASAPKKAAARA